MLKNRITKDMDVKTAILRMADQNPIAVVVMHEVVSNDSNSLDYILVLDQKKVYGDKIHMLWNDCCGKNINKLIDTLRVIKNVEITYLQLHENLNKIKAMPFEI